MANYGMLRNYQFTDAAEDIRGSKLYGLEDQKLGKIDDVIFDHASGSIRYIVVDTGGWLSTKQFIVPADRLRPSTEHQDDFAVDLTKEQVETFPPYSETDLESDQQWSDYEGKYSSKWDNSPATSLTANDRNLTPAAHQEAGSTLTPSDAVLIDTDHPDADGDARRTVLASDTSRTDIGETTDADDTTVFTDGYASGTDTVKIDSNAVGIGSRWDTFQDRLRERRKEVIGSRPDESTEAEREAARTSEYRKAS